MRIFFCRILLLKAFFLLFVVCPLALLAPRTATAEDGRGDATVLIYHHFGDARYPTTNVAMENFREQMAYLADHGYNVIPLSMLVEMLRQKVALSPKTVAITIDDGYRTTYTHAWPVLQSHGFPFTVFLYVQGIDRKYANYLTWKQVAQMQAGGVDFQDHSYSHYRLANRPKGMDEGAYRAWISGDLTRGADILAARLGKRPRYFAIPYGEYNAIVLEEAVKAGYEAVFTQDAGSVSNDTPVFRIPREPILGREWSTIGHFQKVLEQVDLPLKDIAPSLDPLPESAVPVRFSARLLYPKRYVPDTFGIYVSELGWQKAKREGDLVYVDNTRPLRRRLNRVMVSAREKDSGRTALRFWLITTQQ